MNMYPIALIALILSIIIPDFFILKKISKYSPKKYLLFLYSIPGIFFIFSFLYIKFGLPNQYEYKLTANLMWLIFAFSAIYIPKMVYYIFHFCNFLINKMVKNETRILRYLGYIASVITFFVILWGGFYTPTDFKLKKMVVEIPNLPVGFEGYKILQFSDFHLGNWNQQFEIMQVITPMINAQNADIIVFTGDMVNNFGAECDGWQPYFLQLKSKSGNYAVLGNHDYGDYANWKSKKEKDANFNKIKYEIRNFGFKLLLNENVILEKGGDKIALIGMENWGKLPQTKYGNLVKAMKGIQTADVKILLSHDPTHWEDEVADGKRNIALTLSGHTHGGQIGYYIGGQLHSPSSIVFKHFDGIYQKNNQFLYVNAGIGFSGMRVRVGIPPEITLIELKRKI